jgi:N-acetylglucosamine-6-phosphate deacetylase
MYALVNCDIFTGIEFVHNRALIIDGNKIRSLIPIDELDPDIERIDLKNHTIAPGFIDIQVNGGGDVLFNDNPDIQTIEKMLFAHRKFGTTDMLPTLITDSKEKMQVAVDTISKCIQDNIPGVLGIHFEGPFLNKDKAGVHDKSYIRKVNDTDMDIICSLSEGKTLLTIAPEYVDDNIIIDLKNRGIVISLGHTNGTYSQAMNAFSLGVDCTTHLYNAMTQLGSREPGVVGAALDHKDSWCGIIVDGIHSDFAAVRIAHKAKNLQKMILVTDAMPPVGGKGLDFNLGEYKISYDNGQCITNGNVLAGSGLDMASAVRNCIQKVGIDKGEALRMASAYPATLLGVNDKIGYIKPGFKANLVIFNTQIHVSATIIDGKYEIVN